MLLRRLIFDYRLRFAAFADAAFVYRRRSAYADAACRAARYADAMPPMMFARLCLPCCFVYARQFC